MTQMLFSVYSAMQLSNLGSTVKSLSKAGDCLFSIGNDIKSFNLFVYQISLTANAHLHIHLHSSSAMQVCAHEREKQHLYEMCALDFRLGVDLHFGECADTPKVYLCHSVAFI